jgi:hypothetical protein
VSGPRDIHQEDGGIAGALHPHIDTTDRDPVVIEHERELAEQERLARQAIAEEYRRRGGDSRLGVLGAPLTEAKPTADGWSQRFQFGAIHTMGYTTPTTETYYLADVYVAAVKCFGSDDSGGIFDGGEGEDEPYLIITSLTPANAFLSTAPVVRTWRSRTFTGIEGGQIFGEDQLVFQDLLIGPYGLMLKVVVMEHENGSEAELEKEIKEKGDAAAREIIGVAGALAGIPVDEAIEDQALDSTLLRALGSLSAGALTELLKDDKMGEKDWIVDAQTLRDWVDQEAVASSFVQYAPKELPPHIQTNFPRDGIYDGDKLFAAGGGSYKVYLRIIPKKIIVTH